MEDYIEDKKYLYTSIHEFLEESDEHNYTDVSKKSFQKLINHVKIQQIGKDGEEMWQFLEIIKSIGEHHHRDQHFNKRFNQLLLHYQNQIKQTLSNSEIFHIFENNKKIVHFLIKKDIITFSDEIYNEIENKVENNGNRYCHFFIPELENFLDEEKMEFLKNKLLKKYPTIFTNYEKKREEGENDSYICSLIRQDSVEEFISYVNRYNISPLSEISPSIFETNPFLIDNENTTLIEYSAFFGSIQIFRYLLMNKAKLKPSLWLYAIHSKNAELIHLLESNEVPPPESLSHKSSSLKNYEQCLVESIKCHHNDIAEYIENNLIEQREKDSQEKEEFISNCIKYHNYSHFEIDNIIEYGFFYLCFYHYDKLVDLLLKEKQKLIENKIIQYPNIKIASENNEVEVIYYYLLKMQEITNGLFQYTKIKQIAIPSSVTSIGDHAFCLCKSLTQVAIPFSVTSIGSKTFWSCKSLTQITIPSSVAEIGNYAFRGCSSLTQISIPSSVTSIGNCTFYECSSLTQITIPSSVTSIGIFVFYKCSSLKHISIPSSLTSIGKYAFSGCSSLTQITIPSSVTLIEEETFSGCSSLIQITIPSSVTSIEKYAFSLCKSLRQIKCKTPSSLTSIGYCAFCVCSSLMEITIPSSVNSIGESSFCGCSSLTQISIPSSVTSIGRETFNRCSSLTQISIPSSVTSIGREAFKECSSLAKITIPFSVTSIGKLAFCRCSSLKQITIPSSVTEIGNYIFRECSSLTKISIPSSINTKYLELNPNTIIDTI